MTLPIVDAWQPLSYPARVWPRETIRSGEDSDGTDDSHVMAAIEDGRLVRAELMPAHGWYDLAGVNCGAVNTGFPASGGQTWLADASFRTRVTSTGELRVTAWIRNTNGAGGLYVAAELDDGTPVVDLTLNNTGAGVTEEITGDIIGLSPDTRYVIRVRGAGNGTDAGMIYGLLLDDTPLTSSTIA